MNFVKQEGDTCQQACIAMLAGVTLADVLAVVGSDLMGEAERQKAAKHYGIVFAPTGRFVEAWGDHKLSVEMKRLGTLWCGVWDTLNAGYAHCVLIHDGALYDPYRGINPEWPWNRYVSQIQAVESAPALACEYVYGGSDGT